jgi:epoxide hydrolase-like predicted phosphatase
MDYGGVLTNPPADSFRSWLRTEGVDSGQFRDLMRGWMAPDAPANIAHDLETGRLRPDEFEQLLTQQLVRSDGTAVAADGLLRRMFAGFKPEPSMLDVVRDLRRGGIKTALVSNSWGFSYPRETLGDLFDELVISGEVGIRKPDPEIYLLAARTLGVPPGACVFVDDLAENIRGAAAVGMIGVHHVVPEDTIGELEILFDRSLR